MTDQHAGTYQAYLDAQAAANQARGTSQPTLRNTPEPGTPEADQVAALDVPPLRHGTGTAQPYSALRPSPSRKSNWRPGSDPRNAP